MDAASAVETIEKRLADALLCQPIAAELNSLGIDFELTYGVPTSNSALRIDLDGRNAFGRLTWWSDGSTFIEALQESDGETIFCLSGVALDSRQAVAAARDLAARISAIAP